MIKRIAFQGEPGAYSHQACNESRPEYEAVPCRTFEDTIDAVRSGETDLAMLPVENSTYGRVADIHHLLPQTGLHIVGEAFVRVHINLLALPGASLGDITEAMSHTMALGQCRTFLRKHGLRAVASTDTAGSARIVAAKGDPAVAALASEFAGQIYGLNVLARHIEDHDRNTTRFLIMSRTPDRAARGQGPTITSLLFRVRNIPAALYKALGGFATNAVNMTKIESYMVDGVFAATQFLADIEGHPDDPHVRRALDELEYFSDEVTILGVYLADAERRSQ
ncbi:MAG: prephenate dehydratase [Paracoccaceae bacterium]